MIYYSAFIVVFQFGWAGVQISHLSLITDLTKDEDTRTLLTSVRYSFTVISNLLVYFTTWIFFGVGEEGQQVDREDSDKFRYGVSSCQRSFAKFHNIETLNARSTRQKAQVGASPGTVKLGGVTTSQEGCNRNLLCWQEHHAGGRVLRPARHHQLPPDRE